MRAINLHSFLVIPAGAGYDLIVEGALTVTPRIAVDFGEGDDNTVLGATANYRF